jgi:hypothetical protein
MGADVNDDNWGVTTLIKVPTVSEWAAGDRTLRCEAMAGTYGPGPPVFTSSLRGILRRRDSARFRLCRRAEALVTCDQVHNEEGMSPNIVPPTGRWPGTEAVTATGEAGCASIADRYLGAPLRSRPELSLAVDVPTQAQWDAGNRNVNCWLANMPGQYTTGTVRGGLQ